ncbi:YceI family protein [Pelagibius litoralis]|uniref:YceI family protein n=1 Tax=Pelagibius litoralis TaxID=374515 RepID=A0A967F127_9PROT|nr:YceI family protein [Pelagibius litoralis]NIA71120.1 YceI family protein [Pelagibius litoralis]
MPHVTLPRLKTLTLAAGLLAAPLALGGAQAAETYDLDSGHADVIFMVSHFGYSDTIGRIGDVKGSITFDEAAVENSAVEIVMQSASLDTNHQKRDDHLKSADFFNVEKFPTITFKSTGIAKTGDNTGAVTGDLTLLGVTKPVTLDVTFNQKAPHPILQGKEAIGFSARGSIKRTEFGMATYAPAVGDAVELIIEVEAIAP